MSIEDGSKKGVSLWLWIALALMPVFYVLSLGPAAYIIEKMGADTEVTAVAKVIYAPVIWYIKENKYIGSDVFRDYLIWWIELTD